uniref:Uncharacterized protein n=1 Tax=Anopheles darlingi TaxID=43151 RepID=A0A2M4DBW6_ANODA
MRAEWAIAQGPLTTFSFVLSAALGGSTTSKQRQGFCVVLEGVLAIVRLLLLYGQQSAIRAGLGPRGGQTREARHSICCVRSKLIPLISPGNCCGCGLLGFGSVRSCILYKRGATPKRCSPGWCCPVATTRRKECLATGPGHRLAIKGSAHRYWSSGSETVMRIAG